MKRILFFGLPLLLGIPTALFLNTFFGGPFDLIYLYIYFCIPSGWAIISRKMAGISAPPRKRDLVDKYIDYDMQRRYGVGNFILANGIIAVIKWVGVLAMKLLGSVFVGVVGAPYYLYSLLITIFDKKKAM